MNLRAAIMLSALLHASFLGYSFLVPVEKVEPLPFHVESVEIEPIRFETIVLPELEEPSAGGEAEELAPEGDSLELEPEEQRVEKPRKIVQESPEPPEPLRKKPPTRPVEQEVAAVVVEETEESAPEVELTEETVVARKVEGSVAPASAPSESASAEEGAVADRPSPAPSRPTYGKRGGGGDGVNLKALVGRYRKAVFLAVNKKKHYPTMARRARLEGIVLLEVTIDAEGRILRSRVLKSSGHEVLDSAALETLHSIEQLPLPPRGLPDELRRLRIPLRYRFG